MAATATSYFETLADGDLDAAYAMLSQGMRAAQSRASFEGFWGGVGSVAVVGQPEVDVAGRTATVPLAIDGRREDFRLRLVPGPDGSWVIDGPRPG